MPQGGRFFYSILPRNLSVLPVCRVDFPRVAFSRRHSLHVPGLEHFSYKPATRMLSARFAAVRRESVCAGFDVCTRLPAVYRTNAAPNASPAFPAHFTHLDYRTTENWAFSFKHCWCCAVPERFVPWVRGSSGSRLVRCVHIAVFSIRVNACPTHTFTGPLPLFYPSGKTTCAVHFSAAATTSPFVTIHAVPVAAGVTRCADRKRAAPRRADVLKPVALLCVGLFRGPEERPHHATASLPPWWAALADETHALLSCATATSAAAFPVMPPLTANALKDGRTYDGTFPHVVRHLWRFLRGREQRPHPITRWMV